MRKLAFEALMPAKQFNDSATAMSAVRQMTQQIRSQLRSEGALTSGKVRLSVMVTCLDETKSEEAIN